MAQPDIIKGTYFSLMLGDGGTPETFAALCGITTRNFTQTANTQDQLTRDCDDPEDVPIRRLIVTSKQWSLSGQGVLNRANLADIQAAWGVTRNYRYLFTEPTDDTVFQGYYEGPGILTVMEHSAGDEAFASLSLTIESDGQWNWVEV